MKPRLMPNLSSRTLAVVARQFVVQEALEMMRCLAESYVFSFTPSTTVTSGSLAGAVMMTFLAPAVMCLEAVAVSRKMPVDSTTTSTPSSFQGSEAGSLIAHTRISRPLTKIASPLAVASALRLRWTESCFSRWARVLASARSLTPTTSISPAASRAVRKKTRPMRPKPLTPTRMLMEGLLVGLSGKLIPAGLLRLAKVYGHSEDPGNCEHPHPGRAGRLQDPGAFGGGGANARLPWNLKACSASRATPSYSAAARAQSQAGRSPRQPPQRPAGPGAGSNVGSGKPQRSHAGGPNRRIARQQAPHSGSRRPAASVASHTGHSAGKTRSRAASAHARMGRLSGSARDAGCSSAGTAGSGLARSA